MKRTIVQLRPEQADTLAALAVERGVSVSELVRNGVNRVIADARREDQIARFMSMAGSLSGPADLAERHDDYLVEAYCATSDGSESNEAES